MQKLRKAKKIWRYWCSEAQHHTCIPEGSAMLGIDAAVLNCELCGSAANVAMHDPVAACWHGTASMHIQPHTSSLTCGVACS